MACNVACQSFLGKNELPLKLFLLLFEDNVTRRLKARIVEPEWKPIVSQRLAKHTFPQQLTDAK
jgi:hypothetical protein